MRTKNYASVRRNEITGEEFFSDITSEHGGQFSAEQKAKQTNTDHDDWARINPVQRIVLVLVTEIEE